jgi:hypothetical protein
MLDAFNPGQLQRLCERVGMNGDTCLGVEKTAKSA